MEFMTNFYKNERLTVEGVAKEIGLLYEIKDGATDVYENPMPDYLQIFALEQNDMRKKINDFFIGKNLIWQMVRNALFNAGITKEQCEGKALYPGCENEYWPGLKVHYEKAMNEF